MKEKTELRKTISFEQSRLTRELVEKKSSVIAQKLINSSFYKEADTILTFIGREKEPNTNGIIVNALYSGKKVYAPVVDKETMTMDFYRFDNIHSLEVGAYGILEPKPIKERRIDLSGSSGLIIVPGVYFDSYGHRLGRGRGFYDRFLSGVDSDRFHTVALAFSFQLRDSIPCEPHDIMMDYLISENGITVCRR